jgi:hypothetical protein
MRWFLTLWLVPVMLFSAWYALSANGLLFSREFHDLVFALYGRMLGMEPEAVPPMMFRAMAFDGLLILAVVAFRRRRAIAGFVRGRFAGRVVGVTPAAMPAGRERPAG